MKKPGIFFTTFIPALLVLVFGGGLVLAHESAFEKLGLVFPKTVKPAPAFSLPDITGGRVNLEDFKGKLILVNFWATWCGPCREELPALQRLYDKIKGEGVEILAISIDRENTNKVKQYIDQFRLTFPVLLDADQKTRRKYYILGLPTSYLIDGEGKLRGFISGARAWDSPEMVRAIQSLLSPLG